MRYESLRRQPTEKLKDIYGSVQELLSYPELLLDELRIKLETLHADVTALLEDRQDRNNSQP